MPQNAQLKRVRGKIKPSILDFARKRIESGNKSFHMRDLHAWVLRETQIAPASPDRILRDLRQADHFSYDLTNRANSEYLFGQFFDPPQPEQSRSNA